MEKSYEELMDMVRRADKANDFSSAQSFYDRAQAVKNPPIPVKTIPPADSELLRTAFQGLSLGWGEEIEAAIRSVVPESMGGREYVEIRDELRNKLNTYKQENPKTAITAEIAGAFLPVVISLVYSGGTTAPALAPTIMNMMKVGATTGGTYGLGASEADNVIDMALDTGKGAIEGAVLSPVIGKGAEYGSKVIGNLIDITKNRFGDRISKVVKNEVERLKAMTGKSDDEILQDLIEGRLPAENQSLALALKNYALEGGKSGQYVIDKFNTRTGLLKSESLDTLKNKLAPNVDNNAYRAFKMDEKAITNAASKEYDDIFATFPDMALGDNVTTPMLRAVQSSPDILEALNAKYGLKNLVPLFKKNRDGSFEFARQPSLQDAEEVRRLVSDKASQLWQSKQGSLAQEFTNTGDALRTGIDAISEPLKAVRAKWSNVKGAAETFKIGRTALDKNADELEVIVEGLSGKPDLLAAFKAGVMDNIRNKGRRNKRTLSQLADEDTQLGSVLRIALDGEDIQALERQLSHAGEVAEMSGKMPIMAGSPTAGLVKEQGLNIMDVGNLASGEAIGIISSLSKMLRTNAPRMTDDETMKVAQIMFAEAPEITKRAINNRGAYNTLVSNYGHLINQGLGGVRNAGIQQVNQYTSGLLAPIKEQ
jgi:hypothetical protein